MKNKKLLITTIIIFVLGLMSLTFGILLDSTFNNIDVDERIFTIAGIVLIIAAVIFYGRWLLVMFGVVKYEPPLSQSIDQIVCVELLDTRDQDFVVLKSFENQELSMFLEDFMQIDARRYANDPATSHGEYAVKVCYQDGGYDLLGNVVDFYSSKGERLSTGGWYYIPTADMQNIVDKYYRNLEID